MKIEGLTYLEAINVFVVMGGIHMTYEGNSNTFVVKRGRFHDLSTGKSDYGPVFKLPGTYPHLMNDTYKKWYVEVL